MWRSFENPLAHQGHTSEHAPTLEQGVERGLLNGREACDVARRQRLNYGGGHALVPDRHRLDLVGVDRGVERHLLPKGGKVVHRGLPPPAPATPVPTPTPAAAPSTAIAEVTGLEGRAAGGVSLAAGCHDRSVAAVSGRGGGGEWLGGKKGAEEAAAAEGAAAGKPPEGGSVLHEHAAAGLDEGAAGRGEGAAAGGGGGRGRKERGGGRCGQAPAVGGVCGGAAASAAEGGRGLLVRSDGRAGKRHGRGGQSSCFGCCGWRVHDGPSG